MFLLFCCLFQLFGKADYWFRYEQLSAEQRESVALNHAVLLLRLGRTEPCLRALEEAAKEFPRSSLPAVLRAQLLPAPEEALAVLRSLPEHEAAGTAAARLLAREGRLSEALAALKSIRGEWRGETLALLLALARAMPPAEATAALEEARAICCLVSFVANCFPSPGAAADERREREAAGADRLGGAAGGARRRARRGRGFPAGAEARPAAHGGAGGLCLLRLAV